MNYRQARHYLLQRPEAIEDFPFGPRPAVMKIRGKIFAVMFRGKPFDYINLKCDPLEAEVLRDIFTAVLPGYHMNKRHWNTVLLDQSVPRAEIERMMDRSYGLVVRGLRKVQREALLLAYGEQEIFRP